jgi:hypothetical protein
MAEPAKASRKSAAPTNMTVCGQRTALLGSCLMLLITWKVGPRCRAKPVWIVRLRFLRSTLRYLGHIHRDQTRNENSQIKNA